jgi:hypothetical protein
MPKVEAHVTDAEKVAFTEIASQGGLTAAAMIRRFVRDTVAEHGYRMLAADPDYQEYHQTRKADRARRAELREGREADG